jgi:hypothetical protein
MQYKPYISQNVGEPLDQLASWCLPHRPSKIRPDTFANSISTRFFSALNESLLVVRKTLGEECYSALRAMSDKMRALFESDPEDKTGNTQAGRVLLYEMEDILTESAKREASN